MTRVAEQMFAVMAEARREGDLANPLAQEAAYEATGGYRVKMLCTRPPSLLSLPLALLPANACRRLLTLTMHDSPSIRSAPTQPSTPSL